MQVALTGANGFIGSVIALHLYNHNILFKASASKSNPLLDELNLKIIKGRFQESNVQKELLNASTTLIHCAGQIYLHYGSNEEVYQTNCLDSLDLVKTAINMGVKHIVYIASIHAFKSGQKTLDHSSDLETDPHLPYNYSKSQAVEKLMKLCTAHGIALDVLYPTAVLGPYNYKGDSMYKLIHLAERWPLLFLPKAQFDIVSVDDVAEACIQCVNNFKNGTVRHFIISGKSYPLKAISSSYLQLSNRKKAHFEIPSKLLVHISRIVYFFNKKSAFSPYNMDTLHEGKDIHINGDTTHLLNRPPENLNSILQKIHQWK